MMRVLLQCDFPAMACGFFTQSALRSGKVPTESTMKKRKPGVTPVGKLELDELEDDGQRHPDGEKQPLKPWPNNTNPHTGEIGGPKGPEPTRFGDWERKGRVSDF